MHRRPVRFLRPTRRRVSIGLIPVLGALSVLVFVPSSAAESLPTVSYTIDAIAGTNGWYRGSTHGNNIVLHWVVSSNATSVSPECQPAITIPGPLTGLTKTCSATNGAGTVTVTTKTLKIDADPPTGVAATVSRASDFNGWYNHPLGVTWSAGDPTSGIASCSSATYNGPDRSAAQVAGGCTDKAGNSASARLVLNYDATAPVLSKLSVVSGGASDVVNWTSSSAADTAVIQRWARGNKDQPVVYRGSGARFLDAKIQSSVEYVYAVQTYDQAGNASRKLSIAGLPKVLTLRKLHYIPRAASKPILRWDARRHASYYHVQLFRGSKRILAAWPIKNELGLPAAWKWSGHRYRLVPGHYRWYVWAGIGKRAFAQYKSVGSARFIVPRR